MWFTRSKVYSVKILLRLNISETTTIVLTAYPTPLLEDLSIYCALSFPHHLTNMNFQRWLLPQHHDLTLPHPILALRIQAQVEGPDHLSENEAHFSVSEILQSRG